MRRFLRAAIVVPALVYLACAFALMPGSLLGRSTYVAVDKLEDYSPYRDASPRPVGGRSSIQTDQAEGVSTPASFYADLRHGHLQLWDLDVAGGSPTGLFPFNGLLAPTSWPYLVLPAWYAVTVRGFLSILTGLVGVHLLLRRLGASWAAAIPGAVAYAFCGSNLAALLRMDAVFVIPLLLWAVDRLVARPRLGRAAIVAGCTTWCWLEGFPSAFVYAVLLAGAWGLWASIRERTSWADGGRRLLAAGAAVVWGVLLAAFSLLPFASEAGARGTLEARTYDGGYHLAPRFVLGLFDTGINAGLAKPPYFAGSNPVESVSTSGVFVVGVAVLTLLLAAFGRVRLTRAGAHALPFFAGLTALTLTWTFWGGPLLAAAYAVPGLGDGPIQRVRSLANLGLALVASLGISALWDGGRPDGDEPRTVRPSRVASGLAAVATTALVLAAAPDARKVLREVPGHTRDVAVGLATSAAFAVALGLLVLVGRQARLRAAAVVGVAALLWVELAYPLRSFTPASPVRDTYTELAGHRLLERLLEDRWRLGGTSFNAYPAANQVIGLPDVRGVTILDRRWKALIRSANPTAYERDPLKIFLLRGEWNLNGNAYDDLSMRWFAMGSDDTPLGSKSAPDSDEVVDGEAKSASMDGHAPALVTGALVSVTGDGKDHRCDGQQLVVRLTTGGRLVDESRRPAYDAPGGFMAFGLAGHDVPAGAPYELTASVTDPACPVAVGTVGGRLARQLIVEDPDVGAILRHTEQGLLYERPTALPLVRVHTDWTAFDDQPALLDVLKSRPAADRATALFLGADPGGQHASAASVVRSDLRQQGATVVTEATGGRALLVVSQNRANGWTATVDGRVTKLVDVDGALMGVFVPEGRHTVELSYLPTSFVVGGTVTLGSVALPAVAALGLVVRRRRRRRPAPTPSESS